MGNCPWTPRLGKILNDKLLRSLHPALSTLNGAGADGYLVPSRSPTPLAMADLLR